MGLMYFPGGKYNGLPDMGEVCPRQSDNRGPSAGSTPTLHSGLDSAGGHLPNTVFPPNKARMLAVDQRADTGGEVLPIGLRSRWHRDRLQQGIQFMLGQSR